MTSQSSTTQEQLAKAAEALLQDYTSDDELRVFTILDGEDFIPHMNSFKALPTLTGKRE